MWNLLINGMTYALLLLYQWVGQNFVLAIAIFTIIIRLLTLPLNIRQQKSSIRMQEMQPQIKAIQQKYRDNPQKMQEEFQKIGYNPTETLTGCLPMLIQMPVLFGLFQVMRLVLSTTPQALFELTTRVPASFDLTSLLPIQQHFFGLNLGQPDPTFILPILVFGTMFLQQKFLSPTSSKPEENSKSKNKNKNQKAQKDDPAASMQKSMQYTMPIMFGVFSLQFQAGLSIYFVLSNVIGIVQGFYTKKIMDEEKEKQAEEKKKRGVMEPSTKDEFAPKTLTAGNSSKKANKKGSNNKSQSKRKRRSAKR